MADPTWNEELLDAMVRHQIGLLRYTGSVRNEIWKLLDASEADLRRQINDRLRRVKGRGLTPETVVVMAALLKSLRKTRLSAWSDVSAFMFKEMRKYATSEVQFTKQIFDSVFGVELGMQVPDPGVLRNIVQSTPMNGQTMREMIKGMTDADIRRIEQQIKIGLVNGEAPRAISRRIVGTVARGGSDGVTAVARRNAETIARTAINGIGAEARRELYEANADLVPDEAFVATLDSRTTPICRSLDGNIYKVGEGPRLPLHPGERSLYAPAVDGEVVGERPIRSFTMQQLVREYAAENGLDIPAPRGQTTKAARAAIPRGHKGAFDDFARRRMRELTGQVPAGTTYTDFLNRQSAAFQDDILGKTRGRLFRRGGLTLDKFVDRTGAEIPLSELAEFNAAAFRAAGLDPARFAA